MTFVSNWNWEEQIPNIIAAGKEGKSMSAIARFYEVSRQRMKQVVDKHIPQWKDEFGLAVGRKEKAGNHYAKWGVKVDSELYQARRRKYLAKKYEVTSLGHPWKVSFGAINWPTVCPVFGEPLDYFAEHRQDDSVSFKMLDETKGYVEGNVVILSWKASRLSKGATADELRAVAYYLDNNK